MRRCGPCLREKAHPNWTQPKEVDWIIRGSRDSVRSQIWQDLLTNSGRGTLNYSQLVELSPREAAALIQISNAGGVRAGSVSEDDLSRLYSLGLVEQRGLSMGLTAIGMQAVARARRDAR